MAKYGEIDYRFEIFNAVSAQLTPEAAEQLKKEPGVKYVEEDQIIEIGPVSDKLAKEMNPNGLSILSEQSSTTSAIDQWNLTPQGINAKAAWKDFNVSGEGVTIAIIDSGVNYKKDLPDLNAGYLGGWDFCSSGGAWDCANYYNREDNDPMDEYGHGTEMASAILAAGNDLNGIAPKTKYYALKITNDNSRVYGSVLLKALQWVMINTDTDIIYMGIRGILTSEALENALNDIYAKGKLIVAQNNNTYQYPGALVSVIGVGAHNKVPQDLNSENGTYVEVVAPGEEVLVLNINGDIANAADSIGVAAAQVAGALALMIDFNRAHGKDYNNSGLRETLRQSTVDLWSDNILAGSGKVDVNAALAWMDQNWFIGYGVGYMNPVPGTEKNPVYRSGGNIDYNITITNNSNKTIQDLNVISQTLYFDGSKAGQPVPGIPDFNTTITINAGETKRVEPYHFTIPAETEPGIYSTKIILKRKRTITLTPTYSFTYEAVIRSDSAAGLFRIAPPCFDSDNGVDPFVPGTCTDSRGTFSDRSLRLDGSGPVNSGAYVLEAFCLTDGMRQHCTQFNRAGYCYSLDSLPNECYAAPLLPSSALAWTYFDYNEALFCPNGSSGGVCNASVEGSAALGESDALVDGSALNENSIEPPLQTLSAPELEADPEPESQPEPPANPPAQNSGSSGGGGGGGTARVAYTIIKNSDSTNALQESDVIEQEMLSQEPIEEVVLSAAAGNETESVSVKEESAVSEGMGVALAGFAALNQGVFAVALAGLVVLIAVRVLLKGR